MKEYALNKQLPKVKRGDILIKYKLDILEALKDKGYSTYRIRKEKLFGEKTIQDFRSGKVVLSNDCLEKLCRILQMQIGDIIEYVEE
jgi:putative transcriptional regulator